MSEPLTGKIVIATHNAGKLAEMRDLLAPYGLETLSAAALGLPEPVENGTIYAENAAIKAHSAAKATGLPALSDDSGLAVDALDGAPGLFTADWAGHPRDFGAAMARVAHELKSRDVEPEGAKAHAQEVPWRHALCSEQLPQRARGQHRGAGVRGTRGPA